nr:MAG TPA: hypothetical protein [Caudoviricetes sp.]
MLVSIFIMIMDSQSLKQKLNQIMQMILLIIQLDYH